MSCLIFILGTALSAQSGRATVYFPNDGHCGTHRADGAVFTRSDDHFAHRTLPLGTTGLLCNLKTHVCTEATVRDRGPYGAIRSCKAGAPEPYHFRGKVFRARKIRWLRRCHYIQTQPGRMTEGFKRRVEFDLTKPIAKQLKHRAFDHVVFIYRRGSLQWRQTLSRRSTTHEILLALPLWSERSNCRYSAVCRRRYFESRSWKIN